MATVSLGLTGPQNGKFICSFNPFDQFSLLVTGPNVYQLFKLKDTELEPVHTQLNFRDPSLSTNYTSHEYGKADGRIVMGTEKGQIIVCEANGEYRCCLEDSPFENFAIESIVPYSRGFVMGGPRGYIYIYEKSEDALYPYKFYSKMQVKLEQQGGGLQAYQQTITNMVLTSTEDAIYMSTENQQILKATIALDGTDEPSRFDHLIYPFHTGSVTCVDVCLRKQLIATAGKDKTVKIWNYATRTLEINQPVSDEGISIAFHPSGFHLVVGVLEKILLYNVLSKSLQSFKTINIKGCHEIRFTHGGHYFVVVNGTQFYIYNFYTCENPPHFQLQKGHQQKPRCVNWYDDDSGFASCGYDANIYFWDLKHYKEKQDRETEYDFNWKNANFPCLALVPGDSKKVYAACSDRTIKEVEKGKDIPNQISTGV